MKCFLLVCTVLCLVGAVFECSAPTECERYLSASHCGGWRWVLTSVGLLTLLILLVKVLPNRKSLTAAYAALCLGGGGLFVIRRAIIIFALHPLTNLSASWLLVSGTAISVGLFVSGMYGILKQHFPRQSCAARS